MSSLFKEDLFFQNRIALDVLTAKEGGIHTIINQSCCAYITKDVRIETDLRKSWEQMKVLHRASQEDTNWEGDLWDLLTSWLANLGWLKQLFLVCIILVLIVGFTCRKSVGDKSHAFMINKSQLY